MVEVNDAEEGQGDRDIHMSSGTVSQMMEGGAGHGKRRSRSTPFSKKTACLIDQVLLEGYSTVVDRTFLKPNPRRRA